MKQVVTITIPFKLWKQQEAERIGIPVHALESRLWREKYPYPANTKRGPNGRAISVVIESPTISAT